MGSKSFSFQTYWVLRQLSDVLNKRHNSSNSRSRSRSRQNSTTLLSVSGNSKLTTTPGIKAKNQTFSRARPVSSYPVMEDHSNNLSKVLDSTSLNDIVNSSASHLLNGGVIAVPTDTIYGVACLAQNRAAVDRIYSIKGRHEEKPIAISVAHIDDIYKWGKVTVNRQLLVDLLPGPVTVVFERTQSLNPAFNPHTSLIGIRIPDTPFMQSLARTCDSPVALTSANLSGSSSCLRVKEFESMWPRLDFVVDGGTLSDTEESRLGSTVVDLSQPGTYNIIRPGSAYSVTQNCLSEKHGLLERTTHQLT